MEKNAAAAPPEIRIRVGGSAQERWTADGLRVAYSGGLELRAVPAEGGGYAALAPEPARERDVKSAYNEDARARELAARLNAGAVPPLTAAWFAAAARAADAFSRCRGDRRTLPELLSGELRGDERALILAETLRLLLDEGGAGWDEACALVGRCFVFRPSGKPAAVPLGALAALQPRTEKLVRAVNEKLCETLWNVFPGDWERIGKSAVVRDGEARMDALCAALCGQIICTKEQRAGAYRTFYTVLPARFKEL